MINNIRACICIWADFGEDDLTLFHKVPVELVQLGARRSTLKGAHSQGEAGAEWSCGLEVLVLLHMSCFIMALWVSSEYGGWVKHEHSKRTRWKCVMFLWLSTILLWSPLSLFLCVWSAVCQLCQSWLGCLTYLGLIWDDPSLFPFFLLARGLFKWQRQGAQCMSRSK